MEECQFCKALAIYDAKTKLGPWAYLCEEHFQAFGIGLGLGKGQKIKSLHDDIEGI